MGRGCVEVSVRCDKPNALLTLEHFLLLPLESSQGGRHRRLARFDALISYLVCCLYLFCRLGERMHPSRMKSCCQQGASDCKLCKLRVVPTVSANCLPTSICVLASGNATTRKSLVVVVVFPCVCISSSSQIKLVGNFIYLSIHPSIYLCICKVVALCFYPDAVSSSLTVT